MRASFSAIPLAVGVWPHAFLKEALVGSVRCFPPQVVGCCPPSPIRARLGRARLPILRLESSWRPSGLERACGCLRPRVMRRLLPDIEEPFRLGHAHSRNQVGCSSCCGVRSARIVMLVKACAAASRDLSVDYPGLSCCIGGFVCPTSVLHVCDDRHCAIGMSFIAQLRASGR